ncbi:MAG: dihydroorotase [Clostridiaceae bacterium]|nr:dihydroorotase [Clostridiaceae bacterium]
MNLDIINGTVVGPATGPAGIRPVYIRDGKITLATDKPADRVIDAAGLYVLPGMIDAHCHLRDPGLVYKEDIATGTASAAKGGFTAVACMANTQPVCDNAAVVGYIRNKAERVGKTRVHPIGAVSKNLEGRELAEIGLMAQEGIVALSDDGKPVVSADFMRKAMQYASDFGLVIISHCEDPSLVDGAMNEGEWSTLMGLRGIPAAAEEIQVARETILAESLGLRVHIAHVSTRGSVRIVREAKARGVKITCETCPHYFTLTEEACKGYNTLAKVNPPLRTEDDRQAILEGIRDGTIDMIVTDHAPHHEDEKQVEFALAANGFIGFESAFPLMNQHLLQAGVITLDRLVELTSVNPAKMFGLESGTLQEGAAADVLIADLDDEWVFDRFATASKAKNAPYHGMTMRGRARWTIVGGDIVHEFIR